MGIFIVIKLFRKVQKIFFVNTTFGGQLKVALTNVV